MVNIKKNLLYQSMHEMLIIILPLVTSPYISRILGAESIGIYSYTYSVVTYFVLFAMLGIKSYGSRMIAKVCDNQKALNQTFSSILIMHIIVSIVVIFAYFLYYTLYVKDDRLYALIQGIHVISALFDINWFYSGIEKFKLTVIRNCLIKVIVVCSIFIFVKTQSDLWKYITIMASGAFISQLVVWMMIKKYVIFEKQGLKDVILHFKSMVILFIPSIAMSIYKIMDKIMIGDMSSKIQLGFYENAEKVIHIPMGIITAFGLVMLPRMANIVTKDIKKNEQYLFVSMRYVMFISFALAFGIAGVSKEFAVLFWGEEFKECGKLMSHLAITIPFVAFSNVIRTQYLIPNCKDKAYSLSVIVGAVVNIISNLILIPLLNAMGAIVGTIFAEVVVFMIQTISVRKVLPVLLYIKNCAFFLIQGFVMYGIVRFIGINMEVKKYTILLQIFSGGLFYLLVGALYFLYKKDKILIQVIKLIFMKKNNEF